MNIGKAITEIRKSKGINQGDLAQKSGISQTYMSQIESNQKKPKSAMVKKIAKALNVPESLIYMDGMEESDVPKNKKEAYRILYPTIRAMILEIVKE